MQFKGLGVPNKYFATQNKQMYIHLHCLRMLWSLSTCFPNLKIILQIRPSVFKFNLKRTVIFCTKIFEFATAASRASLYHLAIFWIYFLQIQLQNACWASPKPDIPHKIALATRFRWYRNKQIFLEKNLFHENRRWFIQYCIKPELLLPVLKAKSGSITS